MKYQKTMIVEALQYTGDNHLEIAKQFPDLGYKYRDGVFTIFRHTDDYVVHQGDYVVKGEDGLFMCHIGEKFAKAYVPL